MTIENLRGMVWAKWRTVRPPVLTYVYGLYEAPNERAYRGRTCKHRCCWDVGHGSMVLPTWWAPCEDQTSELSGVPLPDIFEPKSLTPPTGAKP